MGDPKKSKKQYFTPAHPWNKTAIDEERILMQDYGLQKKKEIYIHNSFLKKYKDIAKRLIADKTVQGEREKAQMMAKLQRLNLLGAGARLDDVLSLQLPNILDRRLQSVVDKKGLARSMKQARQFITHRHIRIGDKEITSPGYLVSSEEESVLNFKADSPLADDAHPQRVTIALPRKEPKKREVLPPQYSKDRKQRKKFQSREPAPRKPVFKSKGSGKTKEEKA